MSRRPADDRERGKSGLRPSPAMRGASHRSSPASVGTRRLEMADDDDLAAGPQHAPAIVERLLRPREQRQDEGHDDHVIASGRVCEGMDVAVLRATTCGIGSSCSRRRALISMPSDRSRPVTRRPVVIERQQEAGADTDFEHRAADTVRRRRRRQMRRTEDRSADRVIDRSPAPVSALERSRRKVSRDCRLCLERQGQASAATTRQEARQQVDDRRVTGGRALLS